MPAIAKIATPQGCKKASAPKQELAKPLTPQAFIPYKKLDPSLTSKPIKTSAPTIHVKGITWRIGRCNGKPTYTHDNIIVSWNFNKNTYQMVASGNIILVNVSPAECLKLATKLILDAYAKRLVPSWEK